MELLQSRDRWMQKSSRLRNPIRVFVIDNSILTLQGLRTFFSRNSHIEIVGVAGTRAEALHAIQTDQPDVVMLEVRMGHESGIDLCTAIREAYPNVGVLFFTTHDDKDILRSAIIAGAHGYLLKSATAEAIAKSIEIVASGNAVMDQQLTQQVIGWLRDGSAPIQETPKHVLSKEDLRVLSFVASGKTNREIGQELNVPPTVVASRLQKIYKRLRISRRSEAARYYANLERESRH
jgi:two-component system, NarL family, response regulator DevR